MLLFKCFKCLTTCDYLWCSLRTIRHTFGCIICVQTVYHLLITSLPQVVREIIDSAEVKCTCHGISGACTFKTCLTELPDFSVIGDKLKERYNAACQVKSNGRTGNQFAWVPQCGRSIGEKDFLYERNPPNWCIRDPYIGSLGIVGRECDPDSTGPNSCRNLCVNCGRRYQQHTEILQHQCQCQFHFCCEIRCNTCQTEKTYYTCT